MSNLEQMAYIESLHGQIRQLSAQLEVEQHFGRGLYALATLEGHRPPVPCLQGGMSLDQARTLILDPLKARVDELQTQQSAPPPPLSSKQREAQRKREQRAAKRAAQGRPPLAAVPQQDEQTAQSS